MHVGMASRNGRCAVSGSRVAVGVLLACWVCAYSGYAQNDPVSGHVSQADARRSLDDSSSLSTTRKLCVILGDGTVACTDSESWRMNRQVLQNLADRNGSAVPIDKQVRWKGIPRLKDIVALSSGGNSFVCGLSRAGRVLCWGEEPFDEPKRALFRTSQPDGGAPWDLPPNPVRGLPPGAIALAAGYLAVCVRLADGSLTCSRESDLNGPKAQRQRRPWAARSVVIREYGDCVLDQQGTVACAYGSESGGGWLVGRGFSGPLTRISLSGGGEYLQALVGLTRAGKLETCSLFQIDKRCTEIANAPNQIVQLVGNCARTKAGEVHCWNELLMGTPQAQRIALPEPAVELSAGLTPRCARLVSGKLACIEFSPPFGIPIPVPYLIDPPRLP